MKIKFNTIKKAVYIIAIVIMATIASLVALNALDIPNGIKLYTVKSGSMEPAIKTGAVVISRPESDYKVGDVITYLSENPTTPGDTVTHRLIEIASSDPLTYYTKGDANDSRDGREVPRDSVLGKVIFTVPYLGYPVSFAQTQTGLIILIIVPATMIVYSELQVIKNEIVKIIKNRQKKKDEKTPA
ncbi:MAG: signal peptidase I [Patescibacteria group bacterium]|jgi:signal peptidase